MKLHLIYIFLLLTSFPSYSSDRCNDSFCSVSLIHLSASPEKYHGKEVIVRGVFDYHEKRAFLFLDSEKREHELVEYAVSLDVKLVDIENLKSENGKYVMVRGIFNADDRGIGVPTVGTVKGVKKLEP